MNGVAHFRDFGKHHGRAGAHQQIGGEAQRGIGGHTGKRIGAAALQADDEVGCGTGFAAPPVEHGKACIRHFHDGVDNGAETVKGFILHPHDMAVRAVRQKPLGNEFLAAEADDHDFAAEIRIQREVLQGSDRHDRQRR
jgi:hypothetical protein